LANVVHNTLTDADLHASERQYAGNPNGVLTGVQGQYCEDTNTGNVYRCNGGTSWEKILDFSLAGLGATARTSLGLGSGDTPSFISANFGVGTAGSKSSQIALKTYDNVDTVTVDSILRSPSTANTVGSNRTVTLPDADGILAYWASGNTNNRLITANGSNGLVGEEDLTYDGTDFVIQANVGIGTTNPDSILHISDTNPTVKIFSGTSTGNSSILSFGKAFNGDTTIEFRNTTSGNPLVGQIKCDSIEDIIFHTNPDGVLGSDGDFIFKQSTNERLRINSVGNVGIGTSSPTEELEVSGTIKCTDLTITGTANAQGELQENGINVARYRGNLSSAPTTDVQDGDLYADTNFNPVRVYIRAASEWLRIA